MWGFYLQYGSALQTPVFFTSIRICIYIFHTTEFVYYQGLPHGLV
jgi:hypothetical protein